MCFPGCGGPVYAGVHLEDRPRIYHPSYHRPYYSHGYPSAGHGVARGVYYAPAKLRVKGPKYVAPPVRKEAHSQIYFTSSFSLFALLRFMFPLAAARHLTWWGSSADVASFATLLYRLFLQFLLSLSLVSLSANFTFSSKLHLFHHFRPRQLDLAKHITPAMAFWGGHPGYGYGYGMGGFGGPQSIWTPSPHPVPTAHHPTPPAKPEASTSADDDNNDDDHESEDVRRHRRRPSHHHHHRSRDHAMPERSRRPHLDGQPMPGSESVASSGTTNFWGPPQPFGYPVCNLLSPFSLLSFVPTLFPLILFTRRNLRAQANISSPSTVMVDTEWLLATASATALLSKHHTVSHPKRKSNTATCPRVDNQIVQKAERLTVRADQCYWSY